MIDRFGAPTYGELPLPVHLLGDNRQHHPVKRIELDLARAREIENALSQSRAALVVLRPVPLRISGLNLRPSRLANAIDDRELAILK